MANNTPPGTQNTIKHTNNAKSLATDDLGNNENKFQTIVAKFTNLIASVTPVITTTVEKIKNQKAISEAEVTKYNDFLKTYTKIIENLITVKNKIDDYARSAIRTGILKKVGSVKNIKAILTDSDELGRLAFFYKYKTNSNAEGFNKFILKSGKVNYSGNPAPKFGDLMKILEKSRPKTVVS